MYRSSMDALFFLVLISFWWFILLNQLQFCRFVAGSMVLWRFYWCCSYLTWFFTCCWLDNLKWCLLFVFEWRFHWYFRRFFKRDRSFCWFLHIFFWLIGHDSMIWLHDDNIYRFLCFLLDWNRSCLLLIGFHWSFHWFFRTLLCQLLVNL